MVGEVKVGTFTGAQKSRSSFWVKAEKKRREGNLRETFQTFLYLTVKLAFSAQTPMIYSDA